MMTKITRVLLASVALGALCLTTDAFARGGGGGHGGGGGGHFGGGHFGGGHFGGMHFGGGHVGAAALGHIGGAGLSHGLGQVGGAHFAHIGPAGLGLEGVGGGTGSNRIHDLANFNGHGFNRNAFGSERAWNHWGDHHWGAGWHRWGGWYGPVFWPYLYGDVLTYSLWPGAYHDPFWAYGPDAYLSGIFSPGPYYSAGSNGQYDGLYDVYGAGAPTNAAAPATAQQTTSSASGMTVTCSGLAPGVTGLPIDRIIAQVVQPTGNQIQALDDLEIAADRASEVVKASCPIQVPLTPLDRLDAVERRLDAMIQAVQMVRAPLERFYSLLSDGQKARLTAMGEQANGRSSATSGVAALCDPLSAAPAESFAQLPTDRIERTIQPTQPQESAFEKLKSASASAAASLQASCPAKTPQTPVERVDAVEMRLNAMVQAAKDVRPALGAFYATLSDEQKARFNLPMSSANAAAL
jgi:hypothetical protein